MLPAPNAPLAGRTIASGESANATVGDADRARLTAVSELARGSVYLQWGIPSGSAPAGYCFEIAGLIVDMLRVSGTPASRVLGEVRDPIVGMLHPHYWVVLHDDVRTVVDASADQFGLPPIIIAPSASLTSHRVKGDLER